MVELESEGEMRRSEVAAFLRELANEIDDELLDRHDGGDPVEGSLDQNQDEDEGEAMATESKRVTFIVGGDSATVTVPEMVDFDVEVASHSPLLSSRASQEIELELSWEVEETDERTDDGIEIG